MNQKILFNNGWQFAKSSLETPSLETLTFEPIDLPHDWLIYDTTNLYEDSIGWYRKQFIWSKDIEEVLIAFDGVYMDSTVYVNGTLVGEWKYGYSSFEHNITAALTEGENEIIVKVVHQSPNSRWYSGAGIYRSVYLKTRETSYIVTNGVYVTTKKLEHDNWQIDIDANLKVSEELVLSHTIYDKDQPITTISETISATNDTNTVNEQTLFVTKPKLWSIAEPSLYKLVTKLVKRKQQEEVIEVIEQNIGFRTIDLNPDEGLYLNGKKMKLNGVCEHHDLGALGAAFNKAALQRRLNILKEMGVNAIRTAHNMPAVELMDLADEMGFFIVSEAFDMWERSKTPYDYARFFKQWARNDVKSWVERDRNHPSLLMWSIGNEIYDTHADDRGQQVTKQLIDYVHEFDPKRNAPVTIGSNYMPWENAQKCADIVKLAGYNYAEKYYEQHHQEHPDWIIYGSETASVVQSRGIYHFPYDQPILTDDDEQCSALGNSTTSWGAKSAEACIIAERDTPFSLGQFIWTGFDYIGEPTPYHTKNSYFGQIDTATFKKDSFFIYQAAWTDYKTNPMVHLFPYWDFNEGQMIDVRVCSNAPKIELYLNGNKIGTHLIDHEKGTELVATWKVPYEAGELKAIAYDEINQIIATAVKKSFTDPKQIRLQTDKNHLIANGTDLLFVEITMVDEHGISVENANNRVNVNVTGAGRLVGLDNGDSTDYDQYKGTSRRLFSGKLMAIIASTTEAGQIQVEVTSKGMASKMIQLEAVEAPREQLVGISTSLKNQPANILLGQVDEIPLRKINIISQDGLYFNKSKTEITVQALLSPVDTTYREVEWSVVNDAGIISNIAKVDANGLTAKITAIGDGEFRIRCVSKNGSNKIRLISQIECKATGLGTAYKNPYEFISAGLYDDSKGDVGNGNERGIATSRDGETQVSFHNINFGPYGSDTITIPIFALDSEPYSLQIWEGTPGDEDSELVADAIYQKESKWNVYQPETYKLSKRLKGISSISFVLKQKIHIKGFTFEVQNRAFTKNRALDCDYIYGDTFTKTANEIEGIGNNVSLQFNEMDFTIEGAAKLTICGRSPIDKNTIHIRSANEEGESNQLVEFTYSNNYVERTFTIEKLTGLQKLTFIFLPGSKFDFAWFKFEK
ncbi:glycoside hydrolase family 2 TIM barrel-domain containing protein [Metabacillus malikii]|uniref:Beta-galactosidase n=1 Tax=Metabacillus malikii TaxID=1504265 RepID=A0ABT9ZCX0_9BACI|nr:glycoside hydrolase family 2 TIM barrel-domain containing protein [Metabacillus malikii]MDQ0230087.1 beta-galactosidase [Metabacillus malikii]